MFSAKRLRTRAAANSRKQKILALNPSPSSSSSPNTSVIWGNGSSRATDFPSSQDKSDCRVFQSSSKPLLRPEAQYPFSLENMRRRPVLPTPVHGPNYWNSSIPMGTLAPPSRNIMSSPYMSRDQQNLKHRQQVQLAKLHEQLTARRMLLYQQNKTVKSLEKMFYDCDGDEGEDDYDCDIYQKVMQEKPTTTSVPLPIGLELEEPHSEGYNNNQYRSDNCYLR